jgi:hypothetical protein
MAHSLLSAALVKTNLSSRILAVAALTALPLGAGYAVGAGLGCAQGSVLGAAESTDGATSGSDGGGAERDDASPSSRDGGSSSDGSPADGALQVGPSDDAGAHDGSSEGSASSDANAPDAPTGIADAGTDGSLTSTIPVGAPIGSCNPSAWTVTASISQAANPPPYAVDGLAPTRWSTGAPQSPGNYLQVDFGGYVLLDELVLDDSYGPNEHDDFPRGFEILGSPDGTTFAATLAAPPAVADAGAILTTDFAQVAVRAVRVELTAGDPVQWWSVHELRAGCQAPGGVDAGTPGLPGGACAGGAPAWSSGAGIASTGWTATASSTASSDAVANAFDKSSSTRWSNGSAQNGGEWFRLDLGSPQSISEVALYVLGSDTTDLPSAYLLELSTDDVTYAPVAKGLGALATAICFPAQTARYVRVTQIGSGSTEWWAIFEMSVFH